MKIIVKEDIYSHTKDLLLKKDKEYELKIFNIYEIPNIDYTLITYYVINEIGEKHLMGSMEEDEFWIDEDRGMFNEEELKRNQEFRDHFILIRD